MAEVDRICDLPRQSYDTAALVEKWTNALRAPGGSFSFFPDQAMALEAASQARGGLFPITTGGGKTLLAMCLPLALGIDPGDTVILCPPGLEAEAAVEREKYLEHFAIEPTGRAIRYVPYSELSRQSGVELLDRLKPALIVADEAHSLKNKDAARTNRFLKYMQQHPECLFVGMSGTFFAGQVQDFAHLSALALREQSPLPLVYRTVLAWGSCIDVLPRTPATRNDWATIGRLIDEFADEESRTPRDRARSAFRERLKTAPGVVVSDGDSCDKALIASMLGRDFDVPEKVKMSIKEARSALLLPNGYDIDTPMHAAEKSKQLSLGYYYYPDWPNGVVDREWVYARREYMSALHQYVGVRRKGLDTPGLVENALRAGTIQHTVLERLWKRWQSVAHRPEPPQAVAWLDESIMQYYLERARYIRDTRGPVLIWCGHEAEMAWLGRQGVAVNKIGRRPEHGPDAGLAAVSIASHGTGYNLQAWNQNMVICPPSNAGQWQQMIARTHRAGQQNDVYLYIAQHSTPFRNAWRKARLYAQGIEDTMETRMKIEHMVWEDHASVVPELDVPDDLYTFD